MWSGILAMWSLVRYIGNVVRYIGNVVRYNSCDFWEDWEYALAEVHDLRSDLQLSKQSK